MTLKGRIGEAEFNERLRKAATRIALLLERSVVENIDKNDNRATGELRKSVDHSVELVDGSAIIEVFTGVNYAEYVHEGTRPHMPPVSAIAMWLVRKGMSSGALKRPRRGTMKALSATKEIQRRAWAIAMKIRKHGTKPNPFFVEAWKESQPKIISILQNM